MRPSIVEYVSLPAPHATHERQAAKATTRKLLAGTAPEHSSYLLLHHPRRPATYPRKLDAASPLLSAVQLRSAASGWGMAANVAYLGDPDSPLPDSQSETQTEADATLFRFMGMGYRLRRKLTLSDDAWRGGARGTMDDALALRDSGKDRTTHVLVCTHAKRDCRCGDTGTAVVAELRRQQADLAHELPFTVGELGHVGGHKYAANVLLFPLGDWFGEIRPEHVGLLLRYVGGMQELGETIPPRELVPHWRGGRGLSKDAQIALANGWLKERYGEEEL